jgi:hypothetical protein
MMRIQEIKLNLEEDDWQEEEKHLYSPSPQRKALESENWRKRKESFLKISVKSSGINVYVDWSDVDKISTKMPTYFSTNCCKIQRSFLKSSHSVRLEFFKSSVEIESSAPCSQELLLVPKQNNPVHALTPHLTHFNFKLQSTPTSWRSQVFLSVKKMPIKL